MTPTGTETRAHSHYFKDVRHLDYIDVYRVALLFEVDHPALQHALKKILAAGKRGAKDAEQDAREAIDSLNRFLQMAGEDCSSGLEAMRQVVQGAQSTTLEDGSVLTATGPKSVVIVAGGGVAGGSGGATGGGTQVRHEGWGQAVGAPAHDPHAELRKTWKPGQRWQVRNPGGVDTKFYDLTMEPAWRSHYEYRRHPDDIDQEKPWVPDDSGEWVEVPDDCMTCPVNFSAEVFVLLLTDRERKKKTLFPVNAGGVGWGYKKNHPGRIVAYKVVKP